MCLQLVCSLHQWTMLNALHRRSVTVTVKYGYFLLSLPPPIFYFIIFNWMIWRRGIPSSQTIIHWHFFAGLQSCHNDTDVWGEEGATKMEYFWFTLDFIKVFLSFLDNIVWILSFKIGITDKRRTKIIICLWKWPWYNQILGPKPCLKIVKENVMKCIL